MDSVLKVIMPPEFEYLPGLFLPDLERARLAARAAVLVKRLRAYGYRVFLDAAVRGFTAAETARVHKGCHVAVLGGTQDRTGALVLMEALSAEGMECGRPLLSEGNPDEVLGRLEKRVESLARMEHPLSLEAQPDDDLAHTFLIVEHDDVDGGVSFRHEGKSLMREQPGRAASLPAWVERIHLLHPGDEVPPGRDDELYACPVPGGEEGFETCRHLIERHGERRFRLFGRLDFSGAFLQTLIERHLPCWLSQYRMVSGFREICADPLEEMYAGNSLPDRNTELIENIVP